MTQQTTSQASRLDQVKARLTRVHEQATQQLKDRQEQMIKSMELGRALSTHLVEQLFQDEQIVRNYRQVTSAVASTTDEASYLAVLREWLADATEQVMNPGHNRSTSLVSTEQQNAEVEGVKLVARTVARLIDQLTR